VASGGDPNWLAVILRELINVSLDEVIY